MRALLFAAAVSLAAIALSPVPASAEDRPRSGFVSAPSGFNGGDFGRGDRRRSRGTDTIVVYDRGYQGDSAWRAESFNDWWHERPNRSYPAWVLRNRDCQRTWWQGETLTC